MVQQATPETDAAADPPPDLSWMEKTLGWGTRARPEHFGGGLTIEALYIGVYADVPDHIPYRNRCPRGAYPAPEAGNIGGYYLQDKYEQWSDVAGQLYEEAISRRWSTATDVPWDTAGDVPDDVELAVAQVATELCQQASIETEVISAWLQNLSPGYHEVKLFLSTVVYDAARMFDGYRKRAMLNGGGMLMESPGRMNRQILETYAGWSETVITQYLMRGTLQKNILRYLSVYGPTEADRVLAWRLLPDRARTAAYAMDHVRFAISQRPTLRKTFDDWLLRVEMVQAAENRDPVLWEALAVIFGGGVKGMDEGMAIVRDLQRDWVRDYVRYTKVAGINRGAKLIPPFQMMLNPDAAAG
jgi:hypothetical protein